VQVPLQVKEMPSFAVITAQFLVKATVMSDLMLRVSFTHDQVGFLGLLCQQVKQRMVVNQLAASCDLLLGLSDSRMALARFRTLWFEEATLALRVPAWQ